MNITWTIEWMQTTTSSDNPPNCVKIVGWRATGVQEEYTASVYGSVNLSQPGNPFIFYENLTEQTVLNWIWNNGVDKTHSEQVINQQINNEIFPPVVTPELPWKQ